MLSIDFTGSGVEHLVNPNDLRVLNIWDTPFTDDGLRHVRELKSLETLSLVGTNHTSVEHLHGMETLRFLSIQSTPLNDAGMKAMKSPKQLANLNNHNTDVEGAGLKHLVGLEKRWLLVVDGRQFRAGLDHLKKMRNLKALSIATSKPTNEQTHLCSDVGHLMALDIRSNDLDDRGVVAMERLLPNTRGRVRPNTRRTSDRPDIGRSEHEMYESG